jgi:hypothetical protein
VQAFLASQGAPEALVAKVTNIISTGMVLECVRDAMLM